MIEAFTHEFYRQSVSFSEGGAGEHLRREVERLGVERILLIATGSAHRAASRLTAELPVAARIDGATQHVPLAEAREARDLAASIDADAVVSIGGGSAIGLAKAVAVVDGIPIIAVPTTYAGSEATNIWAVSSHGTKTVTPDDRVLPAAVIYDANHVALQRSPRPRG